MRFRSWATKCTGVVVLPLFVALACGGPQEPAGEGEECYRDADCEFGLVCVPQTGGGRECSRDVRGLIDQVERPPPDAGMPVDDGSAPVDDAGGEPPADGG